jgi:hypothetical protein
VNGYKLSILPGGERGILRHARSAVGLTGSTPPFIKLSMLPGGERGIRTPDTAFGPYNDLANRRLQPLGHLSERSLLRCNLSLILLKMARSGGFEPPTF